jgi:hypothetical protein
MFEHTCKLLALAAVGTFGTIASAIPAAEDNEWWLTLIKEVGVLGFAIVATVLGVGYVGPKVVAAMLQFLKEEREERTKMNDRFIQSLGEARNDYRDMLHANSTAIVKAIEEQTEDINEQTKTFQQLANEIKSRPCQLHK